MTQLVNEIYVRQMRQCVYFIYLTHRLLEAFPYVHMFNGASVTHFHPLF